MKPLSEQMNSYFKQPGAVASERIAQGWIGEVAKLEDENEALQKALNYYKTGAQQTSRNCKKPKYVPKRIVLSKTIRSDMPSSDLCAEPGEYVAHCNQYGAVSLRTLGGEMLGVKLDEFEVIQWQENPALTGSEQ